MADEFKVSFSQYGIRWSQMLRQYGFLHWSLEIGTKAAIVRGFSMKFSNEIDFGKCTSVAGRFEKICQFVLRQAFWDPEDKSGVSKYFWLVAITAGYPFIAHALRNHDVRPEFAGFPRVVQSRVLCESHEEKQKAMMHNIFAPPSASYFSKNGFLRNAEAIVNNLKNHLDLEKRKDISHLPAVQAGIEFERFFADFIMKEIHELRFEKQHWHPVYPLSATIDLETSNCVIELKHTTFKESLPARVIALYLVQLLCQMTVNSSYERGMLLIYYRELQQYQSFVLHRCNITGYIRQLENYWSMINLLWYAMACFTFDCHTAGSASDLQSMLGSFVSSFENLALSCLGVLPSVFPSLVYASCSGNETILLDANVDCERVKAHIWSFLNGSSEFACNAMEEKDDDINMNDFI